MAALTKAREIALYQILEVPFISKINRVIGDGLVSEQRSVIGAAIATKTLVDSHLTNYIYTDPAVQTVLETLLDAWIDLGTDITSVEQGSIGNIQGVTNSVSAEREEIKKQVLIIVPFYRNHEEYQRPGTSVMVMR